MTVDFQAEIRQDAAEMGAVEFAAKHGKYNLHVFDRVKNEIERCTGGYAHLRHLLKQARKYVHDSPNLDYNDKNVTNWISVFVEECDRVLEHVIIEFEEDEDNESGD